MLFHSDYDTTAVRRFIPIRRPNLPEVAEGEILITRGDAGNAVGTVPVLLLGRLIAVEKECLLPYGYDTTGQVTSGVKKFPNGDAIPGHTFAYRYDGIGNRSSATLGGTGTAVAYTPNALNQYDEIETEGGRWDHTGMPNTSEGLEGGQTVRTTAPRGGILPCWGRIIKTGSPA